MLMAEGPALQQAAGIISHKAKTIAECHQPHRLRLWKQYKRALDEKLKR